MTEARRARWLLALVVITSGVLLGLLRWAGRVAAEPAAAVDATSTGIGAGAPAQAGSAGTVDLSFYRALGGSGAPRQRNAPAPDGRALRPDPGDRTAPGGAYVVQVMASRDEDQAKRLVDRLARRGYPAAVIADNASSGAVYHVRVGRYKERVSAEAMAGKLRDKARLDVWVLQESAP